MHLGSGFESNLKNVFEINSSLAWHSGQSLMLVNIDFKSKQQSF